MILAHYILWRVTGYDGPVMFGYILAMCGVTWIIVEIADRISKKRKKKNK